MRNTLLMSTAAVCLMLAGQAANAQSDHQKKDEIHKEQTQPRDQQSQQHQQQRDRQAQQQRERRSTTGQSTEEKKNEPNKNAASSSESKDQNAATKPNSETNKSAESEKSKRDENRKSATEQKQNASPNKSTASEQNKANEAAKPSTAEAPKSSTQKQENASTPSNKTNATNNTTNNNTNAVNNTKNNNVNAQVDPQQKVKISETFSKQKNLAPPVRNTNISITIGQRVPRDIRLHTLPREIVTIAPEYRDYEYFTTEQDVVIVSPRTHEIVAQIPRDVSRARAEVSGGSSTAMSSSSGGSASMPCQVMQRTASGDMKPVDSSQLRQTTGSGSSSDRLSVKVQAPNGQQMPEVTLPDREGRIIAETDGSGCKIIMEPGQVGR